MLFLDYTIDFDTCIGTYQRARRTADALIRIYSVSEVISAVVNFFGLKTQHGDGTCHYTEVASFAAFGIDIYGSLYFCHNE